MVTWGAVKGAPAQGAFILTLDSSPRHLQSSWERSATQFSWASFLSGFGFQLVWARLPRCFRTVCLYHSRSFTEVHRSALRTLAFLKVLLATTTLTRLLSALSRSHIGPGARWGSISNQASITTVTGPGWLGAAIWLAISEDLAITRSHPNKASGCRCCKPFR